MEIDPEELVDIRTTTREQDVPMEDATSNTEKEKKKKNKAKKKRKKKKARDAQEKSDLAQ